MERASEISKRLSEFIKSIGKPVSVFETELGLSNGFVAKTNEKMQKKTRMAIQQAYPQLNMDWLFDGKGDMIRSGYEALCSRNDEYLQHLGGGTVSGSGNNINYGKDNVISTDQRLLEIIQQQQEIISEQSKQLGVYTEMLNRLTKNLQLCQE